MTKAQQTLKEDIERITDDARILLRTSAVQPNSLWKSEPKGR